MKKFLSLVLAMIMTMSLVTISAGATEYKDLSDKDEIQYEEAVAVLNRIGVITGYEDGTFRPETELTRGAAAKIIVSLMIGPDAANALPNTSSPYSDVPASHTFAGVISYCKTAGYISGYSDGTFKPAGTLTGYAFAKMLLGALGYKSDIEGFTGYGWTNNVARVGNLAQLFDRISFDGAAAVNRDQACQLALNTLKATMVEYSKSTVSGPNGSYTVEGQAQPRTSNNRDINANIGRKDWYGGNNQGSDYLTLEFGEEHFKDLRLEHDRFDPAHDQFGRPSNEWSYKKVTIGTFPLAADFTYTTQVAHVEETDGAKEKALGLRNYDLIADGGYSIWNGWGNTGTVTAINGGTTTLWLNGLEDADYFDAVDNNGKYTHKVADIANFTDNGTLVEVYVSDIDADWITDVVVIQTQLMTVKKIGSDYVSLERYDSPDALKNASPRGTANIGFNLAPIEVNIEQVKDNNEDCYNILKGMKADDYVAVVPVTTDNGKTYEAAEVYVPETVSGALTRVDTYGIGTDADKERGAVSITVGGTAYKLADWNDKMWELKTEDIKATRKDVTLVMDKYGNAFLAKDVGATNDFMVIGNFYQALAGNKICTFVHGWDISGNEVDLNLGSSIKVKTHGNTQSVDNHVLGELVYYTSEGANGDADYVLRHVSAKGDKLVRDVYSSLKRDGNDRLPDNEGAPVKADYEIKASNLLLPVVSTLTEAELKAGEKDTDNVYGERDTDYGRANTQTDGNGLAIHDQATIDRTEFVHRYYDKGVKFIYVNYVAGDDEVESVEFKSGVQNVSQDELRQAIMNWPAQAAIKDDQVKAVVIKRESNDANINRMLYVTKTLGFKEYDSSTNESFYEVEVAMFTSDGKFITEQHIIVNKDLQIGDFATYTKVAGTKYEDNYYRVKAFTRHNTNPAALRTTEVSKVLSTVDGKMVKHLMELGATATYNLYDGAKLVGDIGDDGSDAVMYKESYVLGGYRGSSTTVPNTVSKANGVVRTDKAEWLNATRDSTWDDIDSVEDLFDRVVDKGYTYELKILLNEKPDSDGFRSAYLIVLSKVNGNTVAPINDPLNTTYALDVAYTTTWERTMVKGDKFSVTVLPGYKLDLSGVKGAIMIDHNVDESYWTFEKTSGTIIIPLIKTDVPEPDKYDVIVTVDGVKDETLSKTGLADGAAYSVEYTVPEGKVATYNGTDYVAGAKITVAGTIAKDHVTIVITLKDAEPGEDVTVSVEYCASMGDEKPAITINGDAAPASVAKNTAIAVAGVPAGAYRAVVMTAGGIVEADGYTVTGDTTVYVQKAKMTVLLPGDEGYDPDGPNLQVKREFDDTEIPVPANYSGDGMKASLVNYAGGWASAGFVTMTINGIETVVELFEGPDGALGLEVPNSKLNSIADKIVADNDLVLEGGAPANTGFVNIGTDDELEIPVKDGVPQVNFERSADKQSVKISAKEGVEEKYVVGGQEVTSEGITVTEGGKVEPADPVTPAEKVKVTVTFENATVKHGDADVANEGVIEVNKDSSVTLTIAPVEGYVISNVWVGNDKRTVGEDGTLTFTASADMEVVVETAEAGNGQSVDLKVPGKSISLGLSDPKVQTVSQIQDEDVQVTYDDETKTFKVTGTLKYVDKFEKFASEQNKALRTGYFVALTLDWSNKASDVTAIKLTTTKDGTNEEVGAKVYPSEGAPSKTSELIIGRVADGSGKKSINRGIVVESARNGNISYTIDFSELVCAPAELLTIGAVKSESTVAIKEDTKKISEIQSGVTVDVVDAGNDTKTVKVAGTLKPVMKWDKFGTAEVDGVKMGSGYMLAINMDWSGVADVTVNAYNPMGKTPAGVKVTKVDNPTKSGEDKAGTVVIRVANLGDETAEEGLMITATKGAKRTTFNFDLSGLKLEQQNLVVKASAKDATLPGNKPVSALQSNVKVEQVRNTFYVTGELNAIAGWEKFARPERAELRNGYYVAIEIDPTQLGGVTLKTTDNTGDEKTISEKDDGVFRVADLAGERQIDTQVFTDAAGHEYVIDFTGVTLNPLLNVSDVTTNQKVHGEIKANQVQMSDVHAELDEDAKTITLTGTVYRTHLDGYSTSNEALNDGIFVAFNVHGAGLGADAVKAEGPYSTKTASFNFSSATFEPALLRVGDLTGLSSGSASIWVEINDEKLVEYTIDFSGLEVIQAPEVTTPAA